MSKGKDSWGRSCSSLPIFSPSSFRQAPMAVVQQAPMAVVQKGSDPAYCPLSWANASSHSATLPPK